MVTQKDLEKIREELKKWHGAIKEVAEDCGCSREWVRLVLLGLYKDLKVLDSAVRVIRSKQKEEAAIKDAITSL